MLARENPVAQNQRQQEAYSNDVTCGGSVTRIPGRAQTRVALRERARSSICAEQNRADNCVHSARCSRNTAQGRRIGLHAFRHTLSSILLDVAAPTVAQRQLRHSSASTTLGVYGHVIGDSHRDAMERAQSVISGTAPI